MFHFKTLGLPEEKSKIRFVWLHGWGQNHTAFVPMAEFLDDKASHYLVDLPGFGQSEPPPESWGTENYGNCIENWLAGMDNKPTVIVGHSFGCRVAIRLAAHNPDAAQALVLIAAAGLKRKRSCLFKIRALCLKLLGKLAGWTDQVFKTKYKEAYRNKFGSADYKNAGVLRPVFVRTVTEDLTDTAKKVTPPVLLLFGENDGQTPPEFGERYKKLMPRADVHIFKNMDHYSVLASGRSQLLSTMNRWLDTHLTDWTP